MTQKSRLTILFRWLVAREATLLACASSYREEGVHLFLRFVAELLSTKCTYASVHSSRHLGMNVSFPGTAYAVGTLSALASKAPLQHYEGDRLENQVHAEKDGELD